MRLLGNHLLAVASRCSVVVAPGIVPRVRADANFRVPDIGVTRAPPSGKVMVPEPVVLIEILSPGNEAKTRSNIWTCTTIPTVRDILAVRSDPIEVEVLRLGYAGNWPEAAGIVRPPAALELDSIGFAAPVAGFYRTAGLSE